MEKKKKIQKKEKHLEKRKGMLEKANKLSEKRLRKICKKEEKSEIKSMESWKKRARKI